MTRAAVVAALLLLSAIAEAVAGPAPAPARRCEAGIGIEGELVRQLAERIGACPILSLSTADARAVAEAGEGMSIVNLKLDMRVGTFSAALAESVPGGGARILRQLRGGVAMPREVPVVTRRVVPGEIIQASDIRLVAIDSRQIPPNVVLDIDQLIGLEPRWPISALVPVMRSQLKQSLAVERGAGVTASFRRGSMEVTTQLVALEAGAVGQLIALKNPSSNKIVRGRVVESGLVTLE